MRCVRRVVCRHPVHFQQRTCASEGDVRRFFASCAAGLEKALAGELKAMGAQQVWRLRRGVEFSGSEVIGCRALVNARTATAIDEILEESTSPLQSRAEVQEFVRSARPWASFLEPASTLWASASIAGDAAQGAVRRQDHPALLVQRAVLEACHDVRGRGAPPEVGFDRPDWALHLTLHGKGARLARRWSGRASLRRRGYRAGSKIHAGALQETTAAGLLLLARAREADVGNGVPHSNDDCAGECGLAGDHALPHLLPPPPLRLLDPMCGSGTFLLEAALIAGDVAPGLVREALLGPDGLFSQSPRRPNTGPQPLAYQVPHGGDDVHETSCLQQGRTLGASWHALPAELEGHLAEELAAARARARAGVASLRAAQPSGAQLLGRDAHGGALALARRGAAALHRAVPGLTLPLDFAVEDVRDSRSSAEESGPRLLFCNPPWGARLHLPPVPSDSKGIELTSTSGPGEDTADVRSAWRELGLLLRRSRGMSAAWVLVPSVALADELEHAFGQPAAAQRVLDGGARSSTGAARYLEWRCYDLGGGA